MTAIYNTCQMRSNFCIFKFHELYSKLFMKLNPLENFTLCYIYYNESFQIYSISFLQLLQENLSFFIVASAAKALSEISNEHLITGYVLNKFLLQN